MPTKVSMSKTTYAFILHNQWLPHPFLVELSRRTGTKQRQLDFYKVENVVYCSISINSVVKQILGPSAIITKHKFLLKCVLLAAITEDPYVNAEQVQDKAVTAVIKEELKRADDAPYKTRSGSRQCHTMLQQWQGLRQKRLAEEQHLRFPFLADDINRSIGELRFVVVGFLM